MQYPGADKLDIDAMREAAAHIIGTHDFKCFETAGGTPRETTVRTISALEIYDNEDSVIIEVTGDGFLYNMVRIIVGTLVEVGAGKRSAGSVRDAIESKDRSWAGFTAAPQGLYLKEISGNPHIGRMLIQRRKELQLYKVRIDKFEGPFDLLIYLLENAKMDIYDIKVAEITEQYIAYLKEMEDLNIEVETEFIVLAAVLIRLKSHMLLPRVSDNPDEDVIVEDPRLELTARLLDYKRTKKTAEILQELEEYNLAIHEKPAEDLSQYVGEPDEILKASDEQLVNAFILFLTRKKKIEEVQSSYQRVRRRKESIESRDKGHDQDAGAQTYTGRKRHILYGAAA